ncbi:MAG: ABC transporter permease, partial [Candidatus Methanoplasma sp.]|nr:ABC transporter permease [Candidatus Methanoplasma sp.]
MPSPKKTLDALIDLYLHGDRMTRISLGSYIKASMTTFVRGFALALATAVPIGLVLGYSKTLRDLANP